MRLGEGKREEENGGHNALQRSVVPNASWYWRDQCGPERREVCPEARSGDGMSGLSILFSLHDLGGPFDYSRSSGGGKDGGREGERKSKIVQCLRIGY